MSNCNRVVGVRPAHSTIYIIPYHPCNVKPLVLHLCYNVELDIMHGLTTKSSHDIMEMTRRSMHHAKVTNVTTLCQCEGRTKPRQGQIAVHGSFENSIAAKFRKSPCAFA